MRLKLKKKKEVFKEAASLLGISPERVEAVYCGYWRYIKENIETMSPRTTFNVPFLGKINIKKDGYEEKRNKDSIPGKSNCKECKENQA